MSDNDNLNNTIADTNTNINSNTNSENDKLTDWDLVIYKMIDKYFEVLPNLSEINKPEVLHTLHMTIKHHHSKGRLTQNDRLKNYCEKINLIF